MNEQQQAIWSKDHVLLAFPDPGLYEVRGYRHGEYEQTQPATHILQLANKEKTLCGKGAPTFNGLCCIHANMWCE